MHEPKAKPVDRMMANATGGVNSRKQKARLISRYWGTLKSNVILQRQMQISKKPT